eukprot:scaffold23429_cov118-Isochrysis_galbana.AAC.3
MRRPRLTASRARQLAGWQVRSSTTLHPQHAWLYSALLGPAGVLAPAYYDRIHVAASCRPRHQCAHSTELCHVRLPDPAHTAAGAAISPSRRARAKRLALVAVAPPRAR